MVRLSSQTTLGKFPRFSFDPTKTFGSLPANNSLHLMTATQGPASVARSAQEQSNIVHLARQLEKWPQSSSSNSHAAPVQSGSSVTSDVSLADSPIKPPMAVAPVPSERTPICRFFKHGELIRKATLSKSRKRKTVPVHKKEIFGSPFHSDYFAKPLATGLSSDLLVSRDVLRRKYI